MLPSRIVSARTKTETRKLQTADEKNRVAAMKSRYAEIGDLGTLAQVGFVFAINSEALQHVVQEQITAPNRQTQPTVLEVLSALQSIASCEGKNVFITVLTLCLI